MSAQLEVKTEVTDLPESKVKIAATVPAAEVDKRLQSAARSFASEMKVPGFRKGKVPPQLVLQRIGREAVMEEALREGMPEWYERALISSGVTPVGDPKLDMPEPPDEGDPLEFTIEVGVRPAARLGDYRGIEVPRPEPEVPAEAIDAEIERLRESIAGLETVERSAADGDFILIDYAGEVDGEPFEGGAATDFLLELGSETLIEGFNEQLTGSTAGETRTVAVTFPGEYQAEGGGSGNVSHHSSCTAALRRCLELSSATASRSWSNTMRSSPASATKRLPRARPTNVRLALRASSTPQAVKPERDTRIGMPMRTVLITISEVRRPVV